MNTISKKDLANNLLYDTIEALHNVLSQLNIPIYIVGATARDIIIKLYHEDEAKRKTLDLDIAIALHDWSMFDKVQEALLKNNFVKHPANQKFIYKGADGKNDYEVDIVPFGDIAEDEKIKWRPNGIPVMSVKCFEDVMSHPTDVLIENIPIKIASLCGQFLIKLDAWLDRNEKEHKDASDMLYILSKYYDIKILNNEDSETINDVDFDSVDNTDGLMLYGAQWLAGDLKKMLSTEHLLFYVNMISDELKNGPKSRLLTHFIEYMDTEDDSNYDNIFKVWTNIRDILQIELTYRQNDKN